MKAASIDHNIANNKPKFRLSSNHRRGLCHASLNNTLGHSRYERTIFTEHCKQLDWGIFFEKRVASLRQINVFEREELRDSRGLIDSSILLIINSIYQRNHKLHQSCGTSAQNPSIFEMESVIAITYATGWTDA